MEKKEFIYQSEASLADAQNAGVEVNPMMNGEQSTNSALNSDLIASLKKKVHDAFYEVSDEKNRLSLIKCIEISDDPNHFEKVDSLEGSLKYRFSYKKWHLDYPDYPDYPDHPNYCEYVDSESERNRIISDFVSFLPEELLYYNLSLVWKGKGPNVPDGIKRKVYVSPFEVIMKCKQYGVYFKKELMTIEEFIYLILDSDLKGKDLYIGSILDIGDIEYEDYVGPHLSSAGEKLQYKIGPLERAVKVFIRYFEEGYDALTWYRIMEDQDGVDFESYYYMPQRELFGLEDLDKFLYIVHVKESISEIIALFDKNRSKCLPGQITMRRIFLACCLSGTAFTQKQATENERQTIDFYLSSCEKRQYDSGLEYYYIPFQELIKAIWSIIDDLVMDALKAGESLLFE